MNVGANAQVVVDNANAISLGNNATITVGSGALVKNSAFNTGGLYGVGRNTIEVNNNSALTVQAGGTVYSAGPISNAEAVAAIGVGNTIDNFGTIRADRAAVFFSDTFSGTNTIINEVGGIDVEPIVTDEEIEDTLELLCQAVMCVCVGVDQMLGGTGGGQKHSSPAVTPCRGFMKMCVARHTKTRNRILKTWSECAGMEWPACLPARKEIFPSSFTFRVFLAPPGAGRETFTGRNSVRFMDSLPRR